MLYIIKSRSQEVYVAKPLRGMSRTTTVQTECRVWNRKPKFELNHHLLFPPKINGEEVDDFEIMVVQQLIF